MFNRNKRTENTLKSSAVGTTTNILSMLFAFVYRTAFIKILSADYLGLSGLFSNVLSIISLAELGISSAIVFRLYKPLSEGDAESVGRLMNYFKSAYRIMGITVLFLGMLFYPFVDHLVKDPGEVPADISLRLVYLFYLAQTISTYFFAYKQTLLVADQRQYAASFCNFLLGIAQYSLSLILLLAFRKYLVTLIANTVVNLVGNYLISIWVTKKYPDVFRVREKPEPAIRKEIIGETKALLYHKVGTTVLIATDNIVITRWVSLASTGLYANYSLILASLGGILQQMIGSARASIGNAYVELNEKENYIVFKRLLFLNLWVVSGATACLYLLFNEFISAWIGNNMTFGNMTVICFCIQFWLGQIRCIQGAYIESCGLYTKDRIRPFIEAAINLSVSILLAIRIGVTGVILGTIISHLATCSWRQPFLLYKYVFKKEKLTDYLFMSVKFILFMIAVCMIINYIKIFAGVRINNLFDWFVEAIIIVLIYCLLSIPVFCRSSEFNYYLDYAKNMLKKGR